MWTELDALREGAASRQISALFEADENRAQEFTLKTDGLLFDYSKTSIDADAKAALIRLAEAAGVAAKRTAMFAGERINVTEDRSVLHTALRNLGDDPLVVDGLDVLPEVRETRARMAKLASAVRDGSFPGNGKRITDVVNIGIGGSDLGPLMAVMALEPYGDGPKCHFISNVDGADATDTLAGLDPESTLVIVASKTFTTQETLMNARTVMDWAGGTDALRRVVATYHAVGRCEMGSSPAEIGVRLEAWAGAACAAQGRTVH